MCEFGPCVFIFQNMALSDCQHNPFLDHIHNIVLWELVLDLPVPVW